MQIILASTKIMNDRSATKGDACQSKKVKSPPTLACHHLVSRMRLEMPKNEENKSLHKELTYEIENINIKDEFTIKF